MGEKKKIPYGIVHPDPFDFDPEDFSEEPLDHGQGLNPEESKKEDE